MLDLSCLPSLCNFAVELKENSPGDARSGNVERLNEKRMFTNITWTDFFLGIAIGTGVYYLLVGLRYYRVEIIGFFSGRKKMNFNTTFDQEDYSDVLNDEDNSTKTKQNHFLASSDQDFEQIERLITKIKRIISDTAQVQLEPDEFKDYIGVTLKEYPLIKNSPLRASINELIVSECEKYGAVALSEEEVDLLW